MVSCHSFLSRFNVNAVNLSAIDLLTSKLISVELLTVTGFSATIIHLDLFAFGKEYEEYDGRSKNWFYRLRR